MIVFIVDALPQIQLYLLHSAIIISLMKAANELDKEQFQQKLQFQTSTTILGETTPLPLFKLGIRPYDYYIQFSFSGELARLNFYQQLESFSTLIISVQHISVSQILQSYFQRWFGFGEKTKFSISFFMKYCNYTIRNWIDHQRGCGSVISEEEILMVLRQLLTFHKNYQENYHQPCGIFGAELIYITPEKSLRIYPHCIKYNGQISIYKDQQSYLNMSMAKLDKQISAQTTVNNSRTHIQLTHETESDDNVIHPDVRDIFILALQLISLKKYEHFYSHKHAMIIWDAVSSELGSISVSHLSEAFLDLLKGIALTKNIDGYSLLMQVEGLISMKDRMCKTIHIEKNQQLAELVLKKMQTEKTKNLEDLKFSKPSKEEIEHRMAQRFRSY